MRLTVAQATIRFLSAQYVERDGERHRFFAGCMGIFGHGNVAGLGQALLEHRDELRYYVVRNEQSMVHTAAVRTPAMTTGAARGASTRQKRWVGVMPMPSAASKTPASSPVSPATVLRRIGSIE